MFDVFAQKQLMKIDSDAAPDRISKWKNSKETKHCYECLNKRFPETILVRSFQEYFLITQQKVTNYLLLQFAHTY